MAQRGNPKVRLAYRAMANIGIPEQKVKPVLKKLLRLYDKKWELIEEENYRALADAIFQEDDEKVPDLKNKGTVNDGEELEEEAQLHDEPQPLKRLRMRSHDGHVSQSCSSPGSNLAASNMNKLKNKNKCIDPQDEFGEEAEVPDEPEQPLKRLRTLRIQELEASKSSKSPGSTMVVTPLIIPKIEADESLDQQPLNRKVVCQSDSREARVEAAKHLPKGSFRDKNSETLVGAYGSGPSILHVSRGQSSASSVKVPTLYPEVRITEKDRTLQALGLITPKDEPIDFVQYEAPIKMMYPENGSPFHGQSCGQESQVKNTTIAKLVGHEPMVPECRYEVRGDDEQCLTDTGGPNLVVATVTEELDCNVELASSSSGEVKISLSCSSALGRSEFVMPDQDQLQRVIKKMEENCLRTYKIVSPNFSLLKLLNDFCECFLELGTDSSHNSQKGTKKIIQSLDELQKPVASDALVVSSNGENLCANPPNIQCATALDGGEVPYLPRYLNAVYDGLQDGKKNQTNFDKKRERSEISSTKSLSLVPFNQCEVCRDDLRSIHYVNDLTRGEENVKIPWINEVNNDFPQTFNYTAQNLTFNHAHVVICLAQIREDNCCSSCSGNCLSSTTPCACAHKSGEGFAYTYKGLVREDFLEECIAISGNPKGNQHYCEDCPVEKSKGEDCLEPCKGHLRRKFIKECWSKCGCSKQCGNRVVQQGITGNLQVFFTSEGKKWGLRTLSDLPKGAFVCEYVGEILTNKELYKRSMEFRKTGKQMFPVLLDAEWGSGVLKDEEALCLETSSYSNIARFINHRCWDANLIEIPVEVETPDHHYYHLALFTTREVTAFEELTWDYGINFDDPDSLMKTFSCKCGSKFCRSMKRSNRLNRTA